MMNKVKTPRQRKKTRKLVKNTKSVRSAGKTPAQPALNIQKTINLAMEHHRADRLSKAKGLFEQVLQADPNHPVALRLLGVITYRLGESDAAIDLIAKAIAIKPDYADAHRNLAAALKGQGKPAEAVASYQKALAIEPNDVDTHNHLGNLFQGLSKPNEAVASYNKALVIDPEYAAAHSNLGAAFRSLGKLNEAEASYRKAIAIRPDYAGAYYNLGNTFSDQGKPAEAVASYRRALAIDPEYAAAHSNLGNAFKAQGKPAEAIASYHEAITINPNDPKTHNNLGNAFLGLGKLKEAVASYHKALALKPDYADAYCNLGNAFKAQGKLNEAIAIYRKALTLRPNHDKIHSNLLFCMNYNERFSQQDIFIESRRWEAAQIVPGDPARQAPRGNDRDPERRLRIGYVSPDFCDHSVGRFLDPLIGGHDRRRFAVFCYAEVAVPDDETRRIRGLADGWYSTVDRTTATVSERIRADEIDILVDLAGHTANSRLLVFAERPAPVQITWLGYPNTTGLSAMDYRLTDAIADPQGADDALYSEKLIRLPNGFLCYTPRIEVPAVVDPPALASGAVTFGSFNNLTKVTTTTVAVWARILEAVPGSRLLLKSRPFADEETRRRYRALFAERGIAGERLELLAWTPSQSGHLGAYGRIDIGFDPFPYNGTTTTCEALWMGVPVVSLRGDRHASRVGAGILTRVGLSDLIADSEDAYVSIAVALAENPDRLAALRRDLRTAMAASPLCDAAGFTGDVEATYRALWQSWCVSPN